MKNLCGYCLYTDENSETVATTTFDGNPVCQPCYDSLLANEEATQQAMEEDPDFIEYHKYPED